MRFGSFWSLAAYLLECGSCRVELPVWNDTTLWGFPSSAIDPMSSSRFKLPARWKHLGLYGQKHRTFQDPGWFWSFFDLLLGPSSNGKVGVLDLREIQSCCLYALCFAHGKQPLQSVHLWSQDLAGGRVQIAKVLQGLNLGLKTATFQQAIQLWSAMIIWVRSFESFISSRKMFRSIHGFNARISQLAL